MNQLISDDTIILTKREREVLEVIMREKSIKQIAEELFISEKTVELHRSNLFVKLDVKNITGLVKKAIALNLLDD
ncbi:MAG: helix-turn-helix transcriptional regulator [Flavobacteriales bacterium]|nr:helix-turn-helix transcriptional regulator [Flavobacteriales bacterium]